MWTVRCKSQKKFTPSARNIWNPRTLLFLIPVSNWHWRWAPPGSILELPAKVSRERESKWRFYALHQTRLWLRTLEASGFRCKRKKGGHARYCCGNTNIDVPIHQKELSKVVIASIRRALKRAQEGSAVA